MDLFLSTSILLMLLKKKKIAVWKNYLFLDGKTKTK